MDHKRPFNIDLLVPLSCFSFFSSFSPPPPPLLQESDPRKVFELAAHTAVNTGLKAIALYQALEHTKVGLNHVTIVDYLGRRYTVQTLCPGLNHRSCRTEAYPVLGNGREIVPSRNMSLPLTGGHICWFSSSITEAF